MNKIYDCIIIGAGPAGVSAAIYLKRAGLDFLIFENQLVGGKVNLTSEIDNYPPFKNINGFDLSMQYLNDLKHNEIKINQEEIIELTNKDNIFYLLDKDINFAKLLDRKDVVKFSILKFGNVDFNKMNKSQKSTLKLIKNMIPLVKKTSLSKKQAKFFNKLCKECNLKISDNNDNSPYKTAIKEIKNGNIISASKIFLDNGSLFARNFRFLLSRANNEEKNILINMLPNDNPILLYQILTTILNDKDKRIFTFKNNNIENQN